MTIGTFNGETVFIPGQIQRSDPSPGLNTLNKGTFNGKTVTLPSTDNSKGIHYGPRKRTNNKTYIAKDGAIVAGKTGRGGFGSSGVDEAGSSDAGSNIASPLTETARIAQTYNDGSHDYYVAVQSTCTDDNGSEVVINWLDPNSPNITILP